MPRFPVFPILLISAALGLLVASGVGACQEPAPGLAAGSALTLADAQEIAGRANLGLAAERARLTIAQAEIGRASAWPNFDMVFEAARETPHESLTVSVPLDAGGRRAWRKEAAFAAVSTAEAALATASLALRSEVRRAYFALAAAEQRVATLDSLAALAERAARAAEERFRRGDVPRLEVVQSRLGATQAGADLRLAQGEKKAAQAELAVLLNLQSGRELKTSDDLSTGSRPTLLEATRLALTASTDLALLDRGETEQAARVELARALRLPALALQGAVTFRAQPEFHNGWRAGLSLSLPSLGSGRAEVVIEQSKLAQLQAEHRAAERRIESAVAAAGARVEAEHDRVVTLREQILPRIEEVERMAEEAYRAGQSGLPAFLLALQTSREARLRAVQAGLDFQNARADLERAMGVPIP